MKRLLILAYDFPPYVSVGGLRPYAWYKYLKDFDVYPIVVTRQWGNKYGNELDYIAPGESKETIIEETKHGTIIKTPYKPNLANKIMLKYGKSKFALLRKMTTAWYEFMQFLFFVGPKSGLYRGAKEYLKHNKVDAIIATGEPFILFKYASALSRKFNIPWIADYRDPWSQNNNRSKNFITKTRNSFFEKRYLSNAYCATTVGDFYKEQIATLVSRPINIITNGYDHESINNVSNIQQGNDCLRIAFVGRIYKWHPYDSFLSCFCQFVSENRNPKIELNFYGINNADEIHGIIEQKYPCLKQYVNVFDKMQNDILLKHLAKHNIMLLFNYYNFMGTKIYDYLGIRRQILLCYSNDEDAMDLMEKFYPAKDGAIHVRLQEQLIEETKSGIVIKNKVHLLEELNNVYDEFCKKGIVACNSIGIEKYSRKEQTKILVDLIKSICNEC